MNNPQSYYRTGHGEMIHGDSLTVLTAMESESVDLIMTSPPFALLRKKDYGNQPADAYLDWFQPFAEQFYRVLQDTGSFVIDLGGTWIPGYPTRSLYHFKLLIMLCEQFGFHLAQDFYWWNPSKLPTPAEWVTVRRLRVKDAVNTVWWLSKTPWPKATNRRVLQPYSDAMKDLLKRGYRAKKRPSGHDISVNFNRNNGASIPPNLLAIPNTESNGNYQRYCRENGLKPHPARYPSELPEFFIRMTTDLGDTVVDPFAGSCVTGEVCERLERNWKCIELDEEYLLGAIGRFQNPSNRNRNSVSPFYRMPRPGLLWNGTPEDLLPEDGGRKRRIKSKVPICHTAEPSVLPYT